MTKVFNNGPGRIELPHCEETTDSASRKNNEYQSWSEEFSGFYALRKHKNSQPRLALKPFNIDMDTLLEDIDDAEPKGDLNSCTHFLVDSELEKDRHSAFKISMLSIYNFLLNNKSDHVLRQLNLAFGVVLKNIEDGTCNYLFTQEQYGYVEV